MTNPLTPPPELVQQWRMDAWQARVETMGADVPTILLEIAQWGWDQREPEIQAAADAELEACCEWMKRMGYWGNDGKAIPALRAARRPKPPSLKEQAMMGLSRIESTGEFFSDGMKDLDTIRRALEALPND